MSEDEDRVDLETVGELIEDGLGSLMDQNATMVKIARAKANRLFAIAQGLEKMADQYRHIASLLVLAAKEHAFIMADTISAEYNIEEEEEEYDEDGETGESEDEEGDTAN